MNYCLTGSTKLFVEILGLGDPAPLLLTTSQGNPLALLGLIH